MTIVIVTPERALYSGNVDYATIPAWLGEMGVLPGHIPYLALLRKGIVKVSAGMNTLFFSINSGYAEIDRNDIKILADEATMITLPKK